MCTSETRSTREIGSEGPAQSQKGFSFTFFIPFFSSELHPRAASAAAGGAPALAPFACAARWRRDGGEGARSARGARGQAKRGGEAHLGRDASARRGRRAPSLRGGGCHGREQVGTDWRVGRCAGRAGRRASIAPPNLRRQPATSRPATRRPTPSRTCHRGAGIQRVGQQGGEKSARQVTSKT